MRKIFCIALIASLPFLAGGLAWGAAGCFRCHGIGSTQSVHQLDLNRFSESVHGKEGLSCQDCHSDMPQKNHAQVAGLQRVDCSQCHDQKNRHGHGAQCADCHSSHYIVPVNSPESRVNARKLARTCGTCHPGAASRPSYLSWLPSLRVNSHGKQDFAGDYSGDDCLACHRDRAAHRIADSDPAASKQCRRCHGPDERGRSRLAGYFHPRADVQQQPGTYAAAIIDMVFLGLMFIGGMIFFSRLIISKRSGRQPKNSHRERREV